MGHKSFGQQTKVSFLQKSKRTMKEIFFNIHLSKPKLKKKHVCYANCTKQLGTVFLLAILSKLL